MTIYKKSQFTKQDDGSFTKDFHIVGKDDNGIEEKVQDDTQGYNSSNEAVATVAPIADKQNHFRVTWVGAGVAQLQATADADLTDGVSQVSGTLDITLEEDQATSLEIVED